MTQQNIRHNGYGVDIIGAEENVHKAMTALNAHDDMLKACKGMAECFADWWGFTEAERSRRLTAINEAIAKATK